MSYVVTLYVYPEDKDIIKSVAGKHNITFAEAVKKLLRGADDYTKYS